ncbi:phosphoribosyltransferase-like protein [Nocardioides zeicaulis]|uniref:PRTase-CE domain-containing protein n=1 Tax=Nocardioides zeicaulis TaxID=1776857 RepID=A0ABV6E0G1_9ACTN
MQKDILEERRYLSEIAVWPNPKRLDLHGWLANFDDGMDQEIAKALLGSHVHIDGEQVRHAVASTLRQVSTYPEFGTTYERPSRWTEFMDRVILSFPLGRSGDDTASGYLFGRMAEQLGIPENRILASDTLVKSLDAEEAKPIIFLDDLAASGTQFVRNWKRNYPTPRGKTSLEALKKNGAISAAYYAPLIATSKAKSKIEEECDVPVVASYIIDKEYEALDPNTRLLPENLRPMIAAFLTKYTPNTGKNEDGNAGFGDLGLSLSFHHGCPNNTLPVLRTGPRTETWTPWATD